MLAFTALPPLPTSPGTLSANDNSVTASGPNFHCNNFIGTTGEQSHPVTDCDTPYPFSSRCVDNSTVSALTPPTPTAAAPTTSADPSKGSDGLTDRKAPADLVASPTPPGDLRVALGVDFYSATASPRAGTTDETATPLGDFQMELEGTPAGPPSAVTATPPISSGALQANGNRPHPSGAAFRSGSAGTTPYTQPRSHLSNGLTTNLTRPPETYTYAPGLLAG